MITAKIRIQDIWFFVTNGANTSYKILAFCDASERAYGAVVHLRPETNGQITITQLKAKTRVTPIRKKLTTA